MRLLGTGRLLVGSARCPQLKAGVMYDSQAYTMKHCTCGITISTPCAAAALEGLKGPPRHEELAVAHQRLGTGLERPACPKYHTYVQPYWSVLYIRSWSLLTCKLHPSIGGHDTQLTSVSRQEEVPRQDHTVSRVTKHSFYATQIGPVALSWLP